MERSRSVPGGTMPATVGGRDDGVGSGASARMGFVVRVGCDAVEYDESGWEWWEVDRIEGPCCRWITSDLWLVLGVYPPRRVCSLSSG